MHILIIHAHNEPQSFNAAMKDLAVEELRDSIDEHGVQEVAARWGFWHLSRFASDYRTLFGESPSQTLRRH